MKDQTIGFIGCGNMGSAILSGIIDSPNYSQIFVFDDNFAENENVQKLTSVSDLVETSDIILLAVKPYDLPKVLKDISSADNKNIGDKEFISIAAGVRVSEILELAPNIKKVIRVMPNLPATIKKGVSVIFSDNCKIDNAKKIFITLGEVFEVDKERLIDVSTGLSGSGPAFIAEFINALSEGGVKAGLDRDLALSLSLETAIGTASLLKSQNLRPEDLVKKVATKGGTTEAGIKVLEKHKVAVGISQAVVESAKRASASLLKK